MATASKKNVVQYAGIVEKQRSDDLFRKEKLFDTDTKISEQLKLPIREQNLFSLPSGINTTEMDRYIGAIKIQKSGKTITRSLTANGGQVINFTTEELSSRAQPNTSIFTDILDTNVVDIDHVDTKC